MYVQAPSSRRSANLKLISSIRPTSNLRRIAFEKLGLLSVKSAHLPEQNILDVKRLTDACFDPSKVYQGQTKEAPLGNDENAPEEAVKQQPEGIQTPMNIRELEVLLALCKAASNASSVDHAKRLFSQIVLFLPHAHVLPLKPSPFLRNITPSPWETITHSLSTALFSLGSNFPILRDDVVRAVTSYLNNVHVLAQSFPFFRAEGGLEELQQDPAQLVANISSTTVSLVGFLGAAATHVNFFTVSERFAMIESLRSIVFEQSLIAIETVTSLLRNCDDTSLPELHDWKFFILQYLSFGRSLGSVILQNALLYFIFSCTSLSANPIGSIDVNSWLDDLITNNRTLRKHHSPEEASLAGFAMEVVVQQMQMIESSSNVLHLNSTGQRMLALSTKAYGLAGFLNCIIIDEQSADYELFLTWLDDTMLDTAQMTDPLLSSVSLKSMVVIAKLVPSNSTNVMKSLLRFITQGSHTSPTIPIASQCLAEVLRSASQDTLISTLYSLGNYITTTSSDNSRRSPGDENNSNISSPGITNAFAPINASAFSLDLSSDSRHTEVPYRSIVNAIVTTATSSRDPTIVALAQSILQQKVAKTNDAADACLVLGYTELAVYSDIAEFEMLLKLFSRIFTQSIQTNNIVMLDAMLKAKLYLSENLDPSSPLYRRWFLYLLESIVNKGDTTDERRGKDEEFSVDQIMSLLLPLSAIFANGDPLAEFADDNVEVLSLLRDVWFNVSVHGISIGSAITRAHFRELRILALHSPPLIAENRPELLESDLDLNTILRRGSNLHSFTEFKRYSLCADLPGFEVDIKKQSYPRLTFLNAALLIESLRASSGDCTKVHLYFLDPTIATTVDLDNCMKGITDRVVDLYLDKTLKGDKIEFSAPYISHQLADIFVACCHRIERVQLAAAASASKIIQQYPSALCKKRSLYVLLDLLSLMWSSCLDGELDEFEWRPTISSPSGSVTLELSDDYDFRKLTFNNLHRLARIWVSKAMNIAPLDIKGLLQTYLSDFEDDGAYGQVLVGRSFALEMGSAISSADQRLDVIDNFGSLPVNVSSGFVAQYTTRQEYRYSEGTTTLPKTSDSDSSAFDFLEITDEMNATLVMLERRLYSGEDVPLDTIRNVLRRAAAVLCGPQNPDFSVISHLVNIPFHIFTQDSINLGASLWLGVMNENPQTGSRFLTEIAQAWEKTIVRRKGLFSPEFTYTDPFFLEMEFAPSDKERLSQRQQKAQATIYPHFRILQFFESHFSATRLGSIHIQKIFQRLVSATLVGLTHTAGHPLVREVHFQIILFGLRVLNYSRNESKASLWKLHNQILSAALSWFRHPSRLSFGGNRLQVKAEDKILAVIEDLLQKIPCPDATTTRKSLRTKQSLLLALVESERFRLRVWLAPLFSDWKSTSQPSNNTRNTQDRVASMLPLAWNEHPSLAIQLANRFPTRKIRNDLRAMLLAQPHKAMDDLDSLELILGNELSPDVTCHQLKYLLYWVPVNPISAMTYFLPQYKNHPFILQYGMRALDSHSIDVSLFYVPQLVQALRHDVMGYVERFLYQTAQQSQLFAHQVIWNMKANAYKDEDSKVPDPLKPTLDRFITTLTTHFTDEDREFYEREFAFFNEITGISGKLRPFIKRSKLEKKEKIKEELRKIKVEMNVYLPSNPDGVVVGINRETGKPLQSHAKAPYMATFRIRKFRKDDNAATANPEQTNSQKANPLHSENPTKTAVASPDNSYEVWQSAIFKVGDDCRQDVLALQMIAVFRSIFASIGLDVFVYPYRVTATAPGCGVIDVLPNSISRDMLGREAVNGLYDYFVSKYGGEQSTRFQKARSNFVKSMAAYSVISYLLQFKDRHNGNIMIDDEGHIMHIDFGFCFDIAPGGIKFERAPFKLTSEMVAVMGGLKPQTYTNMPLSSHDPTASQPYRWFETLVVKAFLASRPHCHKLAHIVEMMLDSGLPCFKPDTMKNFRDRFVLDKNEREAANHMQDLIRKSYLSRSTREYDRFQLWTNKIPY